MKLCNTLTDRAQRFQKITADKGAYFNIAFITCIKVYKMEYQ